MNKWYTCRIGFYTHFASLRSSRVLSFASSSSFFFSRSTRIRVCIIIMDVLYGKYVRTCPYAGRCHGVTISYVCLFKWQNTHTKKAE